MARGALSLAERLSYGLGDMGTSLAYNMASAFLLFYYTDVVGLPAGAVGTVFLVARMMDAVVDMVVGVLVDRTRSRWGRTRPWFAFTALPYAAVTALLFRVPGWSQPWQIAYAFLTFKALGLLMSFQAIPYTALMPMMTADTRERLRLSGLRSIGTSISVVLGTAATMPLVGLIGGDDRARGFAAVATIFAGIGLAATFALFRNCHERVETRSEARVALAPALRMMLANRAWLVNFGFCLVYFIRFGAMMAATAYFAIAVLHRPWMISVMLPAVAGTLLLSGFVAAPILSRTGLRRGCVFALGLAAVLFAVLPLAEDNPAAFLAIYITACLSTSITTTAAFAMIAEAVDYHQWRFGVRHEGLLSAGVSLATKVGMALGTAGFAYALALSGYTPGASSPATAQVLRLAYYGSAVVLLSVQIVIVLAWPMDRLKSEVAADLAARTKDAR